MPEERKSSGQNSIEGDLIRRICAGERELFQSLIQPHQRAVFAAAYSLLNNAAEAEEVAQDAFIEAFRNLSAFRGEARFSTWLIQIALNGARRRFRVAGRALSQPKEEQGSNLAHDYVPRDLADWREIPSEALARKELRQAIESSLERLPSIYRQVLILRDLEHLNTKETAELLEISEDLVKTRLRRARLQMRDALAPGYDGSWTAASAEYRNVRAW